MSEARVKDFFDKRVSKFDSIYESEKKKLWIMLDFLFRRSMRRRFELTLEELSGVRDKRVLDIGCGTGRYSIALARNGASVLGIDFAENMTSKARKFSQEEAVANLCRFVTGNFIDYQFNERFDICLAIGFFDYIREPIKYLGKIRSLTKEKAIFSFPAKWRLRNIVRRFRLKALGCPVYFYGSRDIESLLNKSGNSNYTIKNIGRDYFVVVQMKTRLTEAIAT